MRYRHDIRHDFLYDYIAAAACRHAACKYTLLSELPAITPPLFTAVDNTPEISGHVTRPQ